MNKKVVLSSILLTILVVQIAAIAVPAQAYISGSVEIARPDYVVPGGYIELDGSFSATGGTIYFYLSKDNEPEVSSGDVRIQSMKKADVEFPLTLKVPTTMGAGEYYVKMTDSSAIGADCIVSDESVEVITKDLPTITVDPTSDTVGSLVDVEGEDISEDYEGTDAVELFWDKYAKSLGKWDVEDGEFTAEDVEIPNAFMGKHVIIVLLYNSADDEYLGTYVEFDVKPSVVVTPPEDYSINANEEADQTVTLSVTGFPKGTVSEDTIKYIVKDFRTGATIASYKAEHDKVDVSEEEGSEGTFTDLETTVYEVDEGILDIEFKVDGKTIKLENKLLSSDTDDPGKFLAKMDKTSGENGDDVEFMGIRFPADVTVQIIFDGAVSKTFFAETSDGNGAWRYTLTLENLPGGEYTVRVKDETNSRIKNIGTFKVLPSVDLPEDAVVGEEIDITGEGFPIDSTFDTVMFGTEKVEIDVDVGDDGIFEALDVEVPHVSGGGQAVPVKIIGKDADGKKVTIETSIVINPDLESLEWKDPDVKDEWLTTGPVFAGDVMKFKGTGFKAGEKVTVTFKNDVEKSAEVTSGGAADSDGDLEVVFLVPTGREFARSVDWTVKIAGPTSGNKYEAEVSTSALSDANAKLFFGLKSDGTLTDEVCVGDTVTVIGVGFQTRDLTLEFGGEEVKSVTASYGYFKTTITIPALERGFYNLVETETDTVSLDVELKSKVTLSTTKAVAGATVTVKGTGWLEDVDVDIIWPDLPALTSAEPDEDGNWEATFTVPSVSPGTYTLTFDDGEIDEPIEVTFMVLGPLRITSLSMPTSVYTGSKITITVNVMDYFNAPISGATVTGTVTLPEGAGTEYITFKEVAPGVYSAEYTIPDRAGSYSVRVTATKIEAGGTTTVTGSFYASKEVKPPDISELTAKVTTLTDNVNKLTSNVNTLATSVSGLATDVKAVSSTVDKLSATVGTLSTSVSGLTSDVSGLTSNVNTLTSNVNTLSSKVDSLSASVSALSKGVSEASSKAESAAAQVATLTTLMYVVIIFSLLAFIFAVVSVIQLRRKIA